MKKVNKVKTVIIIGGGFGGFHSALELQNKKNFKTILIDPSDFFVYTPLIHEVSVGEIPEDSVKVFYKKTLIKTLVIKSRVKFINFSENKILLNDYNKYLTYDYLLICPGAKSSNVIKGSEKSLSLHNLKDAKQIKYSLVHEPHKKNLTVSVIGEGLTGIELTGQLASFYKKYKKQIIIHQFLYFPRYLMDKPLLDDFLKKRMEKLNVIVHPDERVMEIKDKTVITIKGNYHSDLIFTCTGIRPVMIDSDIVFKNGYEVNSYCQLKNLNNVYAIGDVAKFLYNDGTAPALAQIALKEAKHVAKDIIRREKSKKRKPYKPKILGTLISIGKYYAIGEFLEKFQIKGMFAWILKRSYYFFEVFRLNKNWKLFLTLIKSSLS